MTNNTDRTYYLKSNQKLFEETLTIFSGSSFEAASLNDIIKKSSSNKGSFYYRFKDKLDLYLALLDGFFIEQVIYLNDEIDFHTKHSVSEVIKALFDSLIHVIQIDQRYLSLNQMCYQENAAFQDIIQKACILTPFDRVIRYLEQYSNFLYPHFKEVLLAFYSQFYRFYLDATFNISLFVQIVVNAILYTDKTALLELEERNKLFQKLELYNFNNGLANFKVLSIISEKKESILKSFSIDNFESGILYAGFHFSPSFKKQNNFLLLSLNIKSSVSFIEYISLLYLNKQVSKATYDCAKSLDFKSKPIKKLTKVEKAIFHLLTNDFVAYKVVIFNQLSEKFTIEEVTQLNQFLLKYSHKSSKIGYIDKSVPIGYHLSELLLLPSKKNNHYGVTTASLRTKYDLDDFYIQCEDKQYLLCKTDFYHIISKLENLTSALSIRSNIDVILKAENGDDINETN